MTNETIFIVGISDAEANSIVSVHKTYKGALEVWNKERTKLIKQFKIVKFYEVAREMVQEHSCSSNINITNLQCEDPEKINNYPLDTPYIAKYKLFE